MRKYTLSFLATLALALTFIPTATAQINIPAFSQTATFSTTVGLTDISVEYSRPSMKERTIFAADGLVPYGSIWRTGANSATKITFSDAVKIDGNELAAGSYAILTMPKADEWAVHFYPYESTNWGSYAEAEPTVAVMATPTMLNHSFETFTISINEVAMESAHLTFVWDKTLVAVPIEVEAMEAAMASIDATIAGPTWYDYYQAATFMHATGGDMAKAGEYIQKATMMSADNPRYWVWRRQALIMADMDQKSSAIEAARKSLELAREAGNDEYVSMNEASLAEWGE
ncbi:MAG: DUF2911 domain-containing protein [Bacteroidota bacterium]